MGARGEGMIELGGGRTVTLLFTNRALAEVEPRIGKSVTQLARQAGEGDVGFNDLAQLMLVGMEAARRDGGGRGRPHTLNDVWLILEEVGFVQATNVVLMAVAEVLSYGMGEAADENPPE